MRALLLQQQLPDVLCLFGQVIRLAPLRQAQQAGQIVVFERLQGLFVLLFQPGLLGRQVTCLSRSDCQAEKEHQAQGAESHRDHPSRPRGKNVRIDRCHSRALHSIIIAEKSRFKPGPPT